MKLCFINGSPRIKGSSSGIILEELEALLSQYHEIVRIHLTKKQPLKSDYELLKDCRAIVFAFPLYVDSLPSHLLSCLEQLEQQLKNSGFIHGCTVYAIVNCGFYEGRQNLPALDIMKCWCVRAGAVWGGGLGIGGGGMVPVISNITDGKGPKRNFSHGLHVLADRIANQETGENLCFSPNFPRFLYKMAAEMGWRQAAKNNGLKTRDLWNRQV